MMMQAWLQALYAILALGMLAWGVSVLRRDVSIVDSLWSLFFLVAAAIFMLHATSFSARGLIVATLVAVWSLRLSAHITLRNRGHGEDYRYRAIRANNEPGFVYKSLFIVFGLQGVLAWVVSLPLLAAILSDAPLSFVDYLAVLLWLVGFVFEAVGDYQLSSFRHKDGGRRVLDTGLWRYTRHPNYFGDFCVWWAFYLFALAGGGWWTVVSPLLMTFLLLRVSGVAMLESTIGERRPEYADYARRTNAFFPGPRRSAHES
jgi:steroid 5-alpha reductase family enzyme